MVISGTNGSSISSSGPGSAEILAPPELFEYNQSSLQAFYYIQDVTINGENITPEDWVGAFSSTGPSSGCDLPDMSLSILDNGSVLYNISEAIGGFEFFVDGANLNGNSAAFGGDAGDAAFTMSTNPNNSMVLGFSLTGAIIIALGEEYAGLFSNNDELSNRIFNSGEKVNEKVWRLPLHKNYDKLINSTIADVQNINYSGGAGSITAAQFLQRFILNKTPWAHLDIAGMAFSKKAANLNPSGATGFGVRLLNKLIEEHYE